MQDFIYFVIHRMNIKSISIIKNIRIIPKDAIFVTELIISVCSIVHIYDINTSLNRCLNRLPNCSARFAVLKQNL